MNRVGELAEAENHHPDIAIHYNRVTLRWWTHTAGGVTDRDRELAGSRPRSASHCRLHHDDRARRVAHDVPAHGPEEHGGDPRSLREADDEEVGVPPRFLERDLVGVASTIFTSRLSGVPSGKTSSVSAPSSSAVAAPRSASIWPT